MNGPVLPVKPTPPTPPQMNFTGHTLKDVGSGETQPAAASVYNASPTKTDEPKTEKDVEKMLSTPQVNVVNGNQVMQANQAAAANNIGNSQPASAANEGKAGQAAPEQVLPGKMIVDGRQNIWTEDAAQTTEAQVVAQPAHINILDRPVSSGWSLFFFLLFLLAGVAAVFMWRNQSSSIAVKAEDIDKKSQRGQENLVQAETVEVVDLLTRPVDMETETPLIAAPLMTKQSSPAAHPNFEVRI